MKTKKLSTLTRRLTLSNKIFLTCSDLSRRPWRASPLAGAKSREIEPFFSLDKELASNPERVKLYLVIRVDKATARREDMFVYYFFGPKSAEEPDTLILIFAKNKEDALEALNEECEKKTVCLTAEDFDLQTITALPDNDSAVLINFTAEDGFDFKAVE